MYAKTLLALSLLVATTAGAQIYVPPQVASGPPGQVFAHAYTNAGDGSEANPYTSNDGTGGITPALSAMTRGGQVLLAAGRFNVTAAPVISQPGVRILGLAMGGNIDPNGESEGIAGTKIRTTSAGLVFAAPSSNARLAAVNVEQLYVWGPGKNGYNTRTAALSLTSAQLDQPHFIDINAGNCTAALQIDPTPGTGALDTPYLARVNALHCYYGMLLVGGGSIYGHITDCCFSDLDGSAVYMNPSGGYNKFYNLTVVRASGLEAAAIVAVSPGNQFFGLHVENSGNRQLTTGHSNAEGVALYGNYNQIIGGTFLNNLYGAAIHIGNNAQKCYVGAGAKFIGNQSDILIDSGCTDTVIETAGQTLAITDNGTRTRINGYSYNAGDPKTAGQWNGVTPPEGLRIIDTTNQVEYEYSSRWTGGRIRVTTSTAP